MVAFMEDEHIFSFLGMRKKTDRKKDSKQSREIVPSLLAFSKPLVAPLKLVL